MSPMDLADFFHIGLIVPDLDKAVARLGREFQLEWSTRIDVNVRMWTRDHGVRAIRARAIFSRQYPHLELVQAVAHTPLAVTAGRPVHHLGYWTDHLERDSQALAASGCPKIMCADDNGKMFGIAYHLRPDGLIVELVDRASYADWEGFLAGRIQHQVTVPQA